MARRTKAPDTPESAPRTNGEPEKLKREKAGSYRTADGRFTVEQAGTGWMLVDAEQSNELGLPLVRGPFATLDEAREALAAARAGPAPSPPARRHLTAVPDQPSDGQPTDQPRAGERPAKASMRSASGASAAKGSAANVSAAKRPATPPVTIRELRVADGPALRGLWSEAGFRSLGDDDLGLARLARRNPGLALVAVEGRRIVGSALGAWDGRRGWIYHVATAASHRRRGVAARLVRQVEDGLRALGCPKVNVIVREDNEDGEQFWREVGYEAAPTRQFGKELAPD